MYTDQHRDVGASVEEANRLIREMMKEPDYREAVAAWLEKRLPDWRGK